MAILVVSGLTYLAIALIILAIGFIKHFTDRDPNRLPGPTPWPVIGNLHLLKGYKVPYQAFVDLSKKFGDVYSLQLGTVPAVVVQGMDNIREVLIQKSHHFDSRPNFDRYHQLFDGNKENSLAFCNWSNIQKKRRDLLKDHVFPKVYSSNFQHLNNLISEEINKMVEEIKDTANNNNNSVKLKKHLSGKTGINKTLLSQATNQFKHNFKNILRLTESKHVKTIVRFPPLSKETEDPSYEPQNHIRIKDWILPTCANIFLRYFCSTDLTCNQEFRDFVGNFDKIFYEVNQGYAYDFLPFLSVFYKKDMKKVLNRSEEIRKFMLKNIIKERIEEVEEDSVERDYVDALLKTVKYGTDPEFTMETALFSLEDIIGGHSAIGNFLVKLLTFLVDNQSVQEKIREEVERRGKDYITLDDRLYMPYTEAVILETLRLLSSPIVPHVSNQDTSISDYKVKKDTLIFLNNYELNMSESLWSNPQKFDPTRFINAKTGAKFKPAHFLPFGGGRRSCVGYKLVQFVSFVVVSNLVKNFDICSIPGEKYQEMTIGNLALPTQTYKFEFRIR